MNKSIHDSSYKTAISLLRSKREQLGVTQEQLAEKLDLQQAVISKIETYERRLDLIELREICKALGIPFIEFVQELESLIQS